MTDDQESAPEGSLHYLVHRLDRALRADLEQRLAAHKISLQEWRILAQCVHGVSTPAALADCLEIDRSAVTRLLDNLEEKELVERRPHPSDKRSVILTLTEAGQALFPRLRELSQAVNREALGRLPEGEASTLLRMLRDLASRVSRKTQQECGEE